MVIFLNCVFVEETPCFVFISYIHPANLRHASEPDSTTISLYGGHTANTGVLTW